MKMPSKLVKLGLKPIKAGNKPEPDTPLSTDAKFYPDFFIPQSPSKTEESIGNITPLAATGPSVSPLRTPNSSEEREMERELDRINHGKMLNELKAMNRGESHGGADLSETWRWAS